MTEDEKFVREHWLSIHQGEATKRIYPNGSIPSPTGFPDWDAAAEFTRQRLEEIRQALEGIDREQERLASLKRGMKEKE